MTSFPTLFQQKQKAKEKNKQAKKQKKTPAVGIEVLQDLDEAPSKKKRSTVFTQG